MNLEQSLDALPLWALLLISFAMMSATIELGFKMGHGLLGKPLKAQQAQVRGIMGATLGMLAFMLAFSFSIAQSHYEQRIQAYMLEVSAVKSAYLSAAFLDDVKERSARELLRQFVELRLTTAQAVGENDMEQALNLVKQAGNIEVELWHLAVGETSDTETTGSEVFAQSIIAMIDANTQRKQVSLYNRVSSIIWLTLVVMSALAMTVMGYQAGLTGARSRLATWSLALTFSLVMTLVIDLDRPMMSLFSLNNQQMTDMQAYMAEDLGPRAESNAE